MSLKIIFCNLPFSQLILMKDTDLLVPAIFLMDLTQLRPGKLALAADQV